MRTSNLALLFLLVASLSSGAAWAASTSPYKESKIKEETKVYIIDIKRPVFSDPAVNRDIDNFIKQNIAELKKIEPPSPDDPRHYQNSLYITYDKPFISGRYISVVFYVETYDGGAHPYTIVATKNYDQRNGKPLKLADITPIKSAKLKGLLTNKLLATIDRADEEMITSGVAAYKTDNFALGPTTITFYFSPAEVAPHAAGPQQASFKLPELGR